MVERVKWELLELPLPIRVENQTQYPIADKTEYYTNAIIKDFKNVR